MDRIRPQLTMPLTNSKKVIQGELIDGSSRDVPGNSLDRAADQLQSKQGLAGMLCPRGIRQIRERLSQQELHTLGEMAIHRIESEAEARVQEIELIAEQKRAQLLTAENEVMGRLKREQKELAQQAMVSEIEAERRRQVDLAECDMLESDREVLANLYKQRAHLRIADIANEHGSAMRENGNE